MTLPDVVFTCGCASLICVCIFLAAQPAVSLLRTWVQEAAVRGNASTLQLAAETYAARNMGRYPEDPLDLLVFLPRGEVPRNPYSGKGVDFTIQPGDVTYRSSTRGGDYLIEAYGLTKDGKPSLLVSLKGRAKKFGQR